MGACGGGPEWGKTPDEEEQAREEARPSGRGEWAYRTEFIGVSDAELADILKRTSQAAALEGKPPASRIRLVRRIEDDIPRLRRALRSDGYYGAKIAYGLSEKDRPIKVRFTIDPGPAYRLQSFDIAYAPPPDSADALPREPNVLGLRLGMRARGAPVVEAEKKLIGELGKIGRPLARVADRRVVVDHESRTMAVSLTVDPGPVARFGAVRFEGLDSVEEGYLRRLKRWTEGDRYDQGKVDDFEKALRDANLFESVTVRHAGAVTERGALPLTVRARERKHRTIGVGLNYSSSEGVGGEAFWEHRNLFGEQESLRLSLTIAEIRQAATMDFRKPNFLRLDRDLLSRTAFTRQDTDAFEEASASQLLGLEWKIGKIWRAAAGGSLEYIRVTDKAADHDFTLVGIPGSVRRDDTDNPLDPTKGSRMQFRLTPYYVFGDRPNPLLSAELSGSAYYSVLSRGRFVIAARAKIGSLTGAETKDIPATKRFYAGGGGSIRGYEYQKVGPLNAEGDPLGGRSVFEVGLDLRFRITDTIGIVPFIEAGDVYDESFPEFSRDPLAAVGLGLRYFTAIGPLRLDVAFPINGREGVDETFQFYISLGQAF